MHFELGSLETIVFGENGTEAWTGAASPRVSKGSLAGLPEVTGTKVSLLKLSFRRIQFVFFTRAFHRRAQLFAKEAPPE
jgi:hypothetical protein